MQPGQFLFNKNGEKRKIIHVSGPIIFYSQKGNYESLEGFDTLNGVDLHGWSPLEEPWVPKEGEEYFFLADNGETGRGINKKIRYDVFRSIIGNVFRTSKEVEGYRQKLIEKMGRKEN